MSSTTPQQIDSWRQARSEHQQLEFKEAKNQFAHDKLCRYCVALANERGGVLLLGIKDKPPRKVVGTAACNNVVGKAEQLHRDLGFRVDIEEVNHPDGRVLVFHIPGRPNSTAYNYKGAYLMRSGEELVPMSEDQLRRIFAEGEPNWLDEISLDSLSAQDIVDLLDTHSYFQLLDRPYPTDRDGVIQVLADGRLIEGSSNRFSIRRIAAVLLAQDLSKFPEIERKAARVVVYSGDSKTETKLDRTGKAGYAVGFSGLVTFVMSQLPQNEVLENALRKEQKLIPERSIRELVANALVHQDFLVRGAGVMVEVFNNRVEISNPGLPVVEPERFIDGFRSRNERLADIMRRMRICEEKGSGIDRVITDAEIFQLPAPEFRVGVDRTFATIFGPKDFSDMGRDDRVRACFQHCALKWVVHERMTNASLRERFGLGDQQRTTVSQIISQTVEAGKIRPDESKAGSKKFAQYLPYFA